MAAPMAGRSAPLAMGLRAGLCRYPWLSRPVGSPVSSTCKSSLVAPSCPAGSPVLLPDGVRVLPDFVTPEEEGSLLAELEGKLRKGRYEDGHWDQAIHGFREIEKAHWTEENSRIIQRVRDVAFPPDVPQLFLVHILDLKAEGYIKPHIDSVKFCGSTIAGLSLLSSSIMRLVHEQNPQHSADLLLERRSLYILSGRARYEFTHEILKNEDSVFNGKKIPRERRISVICRNLPMVGENIKQTQD